MNSANDSLVKTQIGSVLQKCFFLRYFLEINFSFNEKIFHKKTFLNEPLHEINMAQKYTQEFFSHTSANGCCCIFEAQQMIHTPKPHSIWCMSLSCYEMNSSLQTFQKSVHMWNWYFSKIENLLFMPFKTLPFSMKFVRLFEKL